MLTKASRLHAQQNNTSIIIRRGNNGKISEAEKIKLGRKSFTVPVEALSYGIGLFSKIAAAFTSSLGAFLVFTWSGYIKSTIDAAYAAQDDKTLIRFLIIYTIIPACFVVLQIVPILFYDLNKKKKEKISKALIERRGIIEE